ncbi:TetR/AcrR family transcriptional regulator [Marinobacter sp. OP 3.4]|uniref:TetR/AcrR family transcriptional regulator n=1 Tax=Marinobacter sp. OP 3.4 TaxID=3076501 RepID=UPI002E1A78F8
MTGKRRGRPPKYDRDTALAQAAEVFWERGFAATSLDDLAQAMNMNRPSLYNAFGDKETLYRQAMAWVDRRLSDQLGTALDTEPDLNRALKAFYDKALTVYLGRTTPLGCFAICTATAPAPRNEAIRRDLAGIIARVDEALIRRLQQAQSQGAYQASGSVHDIARVLQAVLHSLAVRARAGESHTALEKIYNAAVDAIVPEMPPLQN